MSLSPKTLGVLLEIAVYGAPDGVKGLSREFGVGREQINSALAELASMGFVRLLNGKTAKGTFWYKVEITAEGVAYAHNWMTGKKPLRVLPNGETRISISLNSDIADTYIADIPYSREQYGLYPYSVNQDVKTSFHVTEDKNKEGETMSLGGTPIDPDDLEYERQKDAARKKAERQEQSEAHYKKRQMARAKKTVDQWTPTDVINYYAEKCKTLWNVAEVARTQRPKLVKAMERFRIDNNTNGKIDKELLDNFLASYKYDHKTLYNPEQLFWSFLNYAPSKVKAVEIALQPENMDVVLAAREKARAEREAYLQSRGK